ncbi:MAG TPA: hypothetical protein VF530_12420 [Planctomycetota bacterium]
MANGFLAFGLSCVLGVPVATQAAPLQELMSPDPTQTGLFGYSLALSGDRMVIGEVFDVDFAGQAGAAHVYERTGTGAWQPVFKLLGSDGDPNDLFGNSVAIEGERVLVGAPGDDEPTRGSGSAYVFERQPGGQWLERQKIAPQVTGESFGRAVALQGNRALIGAPRVSPQPGHAFVYERGANGQWTPVAELQANDVFTGNSFGGTLALEGDRALIGAELDPQRGSAAGAVYVFERNAAGQWLQTAKLIGSDVSAGDRFGRSLALAGNHLLIGAPVSDTTLQAVGAVYAFERDATGAWLETAKLVPADLETGDQLGESIAISGRRALVGAYLDNVGPAFGPGRNAGSAYVFERDAAEHWVQTGKILPPVPEAEGRFGITVALQGDEALVSATGEGVNDSGQVHAFDAEPLEVDRTTLSGSAGGGKAWVVERRVTLELNAGPSFAGLPYRVLGSLSGTSPGLTLPGGLHLPLNADAYFSYTLAPSGPPLSSSFGALDASGRAQALFELPGRIPPALLGRTLGHAFIVTDPGTGDALFVSNVQPLVIGP